MRVMIPTRKAEPSTRCGRFATNDPHGVAHNNCRTEIGDEEVFGLETIYLKSWKPIWVLQWRTNGTREVS